MSRGSRGSGQEGTTGRVLVDASGLIALARIGRLELLGHLLGTVHVTRSVLSEVTEPDEPGADRIERLVEAGDIRVVEDDEAPEPLLDLGLGPGEASLIAASGPDDHVILDDRNARRAAQARGIRFTGLLGLLVAGVRGGYLDATEGISVLRALARSDFRMTVELYDWARERMEQTGQG